MDGNRDEQIDRAEALLREVKDLLDGAASFRARVLIEMALIELANQRDRRGSDKQSQPSD